jgi:hypothetical protein
MDVIALKPADALRPQPGQAFQDKEGSSTISNRVAESLTKSKSSNEELLATIRKLIHA